MSDQIDWPEYYDPNGVPRQKIPPGQADRPEWSRAACKEAGHQLALRFARDTGFAGDYLKIVQDYDNDKTSDAYLPRYRRMIVNVYGDKEGAPFNEHDFANVHRVAWLHLLGAFAALVNYNPHRKNDKGDWGDPASGEGISSGKDHEVQAESTEQAAEPKSQPGGFQVEMFHNVPNKTGYFAITAAEIQVPVVTG